MPCCLLFIKGKQMPRMNEIFALMRLGYDFETATKFIDGFHTCELFMQEDRYGIHFVSAEAICSPVFAIARC